MPQAFTPILDSTTTANTYSFVNNTNCYYCSVAALCNKTVGEFFKISEVMQQDQATPGEIVNLWRAGGVHNVDYTQFNSEELFHQQITRSMPLESAVGLAYTRQDGTGHMVVFAKEANGNYGCIDYQHNPPVISSFPPEPNINSVFVFYKTP